MIIDGRKIADEILEQVKLEVTKLSFQPVFCDVLVGDDSASAQYVRMKGRKAESLGIRFQQANFPSTISEADLLNEIHQLNGLSHMSGLIIQLPLPPQFDRQKILDAIDPSIDVDCTGQVNADLFYSGKSVIQFPTAAAVIQILDSLNLDLSTKKILVIGRGLLVGKPVSFLLKARGLAVQEMNSKTPNPDELLKQADVIISAVGKAGLITGNKIKPGAVIIDAGTSESEGGVVGDVDAASVAPVADFLSPVPGGVGPVTVAMLLKNVLTVARSM